MRRFRALPLVAAGVLALATAACSSAASSISSSPSSTNSSGSSSALLSGPTHYPFTFTQPNGVKVTIKAPPTRVVAIDNPMFAVEELSILGVKPVGFQVIPQAISEGGLDSRGVPTVISGKVAGSYTWAGTAAADLETIVSLHPDLIVGTSGSLDSDIPQLEAIAPMASYDEAQGGTGPGIEGVGWYPSLRLFAQVLNRPAQFNAFITKYEAAAAAVRPALTGKTLQIVNPFSTSQVVVFGPKEEWSPIFTLVGFTVPSIPAGGQVTSLSPAPGHNSEELSMERIDELTGQYLVLIGTYSGASSVRAFLANPLVKKLPAVKAGHVVATGPGTLLGDFPVNGPLDQLAAIPDLPKAFEGGQG